MALRLRRPLPRPRTARAPALLLAAWLLVGAACATGPQRRPTFVGRTEGARETPEAPVGLNPLAALDRCPPAAEALPLSQQVLISPPQHFSRRATRMIVQLREALVERSRHGTPVEMWLAGRRLDSAAAARAEGRRCGAMVVFWEPRGTGTLEITLPRAARIPLRQMVRERLCEFGNHQEQLTALYMTVLGLAALLENRHDEALYYMQTANRIDDRCLRLPAPAGTPARDPAPATPGSGEAP